MAWIWFGAAISLAEIMTGTLFAPLGFAKAISAIILGHILGGFLMYAVAYISASTNQTAMEAVSTAFGKRTAHFFAGLNALQLVGWTAVMIATGAVCANSVYSLGTTLWSIILGAFIALWLALGLFRSGKIAVFTVTAFVSVLAIVVVMLVVQEGESAKLATGNISFAQAVELSLAMPISWLPVVGDYMQGTKKHALTASLVYGLTSVAMYIIGLSLAIKFACPDIASFLSKLGFMGPAIILILLSTVTTTFLDAYSTGQCVRCIFPKVSAKTISLLTCLVGTVLALLLSTERYETFLTLISSAFTPMAIILILSFFVFHRDLSQKNFDYGSFCVWLLGFALYQILMDSPVGSTLPMVFSVSVFSTLVFFMQKKVS